jgi:hypothetical protein
MLKRELRFDGPGKYAVTTKDEANPEIFEMFRAEKGKIELGDSSKTGSQFIVEIKDQSELLSLLNILYDNHNTIIKVEFLSNMMI